MILLTIINELLMDCISSSYEFSLLKSYSSLLIYQLGLLSSISDLNS